MNLLRTVDDVIAALPARYITRLEAPSYVCQHETDLGGRPRIGLAVESMKRHMSDEGWQIFQGLEANGWNLAGKRLTGPGQMDETVVYRILKRFNPGVVLVQDKREWDLCHRDFRDPEARFLGVNELAVRPDIFKLTILKDSHQRNDYHAESAREMGVHAWVVYYHPRIVCHLAPHVRPQHLIRTWHSINPDLVPAWGSEPRRDRTLISGATSACYPLRTRLMQHVREIPGAYRQRHPGYHMRGCETPEFLRLLSGFKVSVCTSSIYGYALRKIVESTACGCVVVTDLPTDEVMPGIDENLVRVSPAIAIHEMSDLVTSLCKSWDEGKQMIFSQIAKTWYDFKEVGKRLTDDIETMRRNYKT